MHKDSLTPRKTTRSELFCGSLSDSNLKEAKLTQVISQLDNAYLSLRSQIRNIETAATSCMDQDVLTTRESCTNKISTVNEEPDMTQKPIDLIGDFFEALYKFVH